MKINFHRVLLGFFENWDKLPQKKWDKGVLWEGFHLSVGFGKILVIQ